MAKHPLYDIAVSEVRGEATAAEKAELASNVVAWRDALLSVIDEVDAQFVVEEDKFEDAVKHLDEDDPEYGYAKDAYETWKGRVRTFKKHITGRLLAVKRMCQEEAAGSSSQAEITLLAIGLRNADGGTDDEWDEAITALFAAVDKHLSAG